MKIWNKRFLKHNQFDHDRLHIVLQGPVVGGEGVFKIFLPWGFFLPMIFSWFSIFEIVDDLFFLSYFFFCFFARQSIFVFLIRYIYFLKFDVPLKFYYPGQSSPFATLPPLITLLLGTGYFFFLVIQTTCVPENGAPGMDV